MQIEYLVSHADEKQAALSAVTRRCLIPESRLGKHI
jgi:hypothetical protein